MSESESIPKAKPNLDRSLDDLIKEQGFGLKKGKPKQEKRNSGKAQRGNKCSGGGNQGSGHRLVVVNNGGINKVKVPMPRTSARPQAPAEDWWVQLGGVAVGGLGAWEPLKIVSYERDSHGQSHCYRVLWKGCENAEPTYELCSEVDKDQVYTDLLRSFSNGGHRKSRAASPAVDLNAEATRDADDDDADACVVVKEVTATQREAAARDAAVDLDDRPQQNLAPTAAKAGAPGSGYRYTVPSVSA